MGEATGPLITLMFTCVKNLARQKNLLGKRQHGYLTAVFTFAATHHLQKMSNICNTWHFLGAEFDLFLPDSSTKHGEKTYHCCPICPTTAVCQMFILRLFGYKPLSKCPETRRYKENNCCASLIALFFFFFG